MTDKLQKFIILLVALGLISILCTSLAHRFFNPGLTIPSFGTQTAVSGDAQVMNMIGTLMKESAKNPADKAVLIKLVENLIAIGQWQTAENFAQKALALDSPESPDTRLLYLLAIINHNLGHNEQAAELLEKLLEKDENPSARYSLGILYTHFLNQPEKGIQHFRIGIQDKSASDSLKATIREELIKAERRGAVPNTQSDR